MASAAAAAAVAKPSEPGEINWKKFIFAVDLLLPDQQQMMDDKESNQQQDGDAPALMSKSRRPKALPVLIAADPTIAELVEGRREELLAFM